jgi:hypothetical protein
MTTFIEFLCITIGATLIGSEYSAALGWGIWFIAISLH